MSSATRTTVICKFYFQYNVQTIYEIDVTVDTSKNSYSVTKITKITAQRDINNILNSVRIVNGKGGGLTQTVTIPRANGTAGGVVSTIGRVPSTGILVGVPSGTYVIQNLNTVQRTSNFQTVLSNAQRIFLAKYGFQPGTLIAV
jgi:hypothetical protein